MANDAVTRAIRATGQITNQLKQKNMKTNKEIKTKYGYKFTINKGINLLTDEIKEYLYNFNPTLFFKNIDSFHYFIDQKVNNTKVWIESIEINFDNKEIKINLYK